MIMVDDMEIIPPRKMQSILLHPMSVPTPAPVRIIIVITVTAIVKALPPTVASFLKLKSRPRPNIRNIMPISAHITISA